MDQTRADSAAVRRPGRRAPASRSSRRARAACRARPCRRASSRRAARRPTSTRPSRDRRRTARFPRSARSTDDWSNGPASRWLRSRSRAPCSRSPSARIAIGRIVAVVGGIEAGRPIALGHERRGADHPRAGRRAEPVRAGAVIAMGMGDQDRLDFLALDRGEQRREMRIVLRARIDDRDRASPTI